MLTPHPSPFLPYKVFESCLYLCSPPPRLLAATNPRWELYTLQSHTYTEGSVPRRSALSLSPKTVYSHKWVAKGRDAKESPVIALKHGSKTWNSQVSLFISPCLLLAFFTAVPSVFEFRHQFSPPSYLLTLLSNLALERTRRLQPWQPFHTECANITMFWLTLLLFCGSVCCVYIPSFSTLASCQGRK